jgi:hypothetical protein
MYYQFISPYAAGSTGALRTRTQHRRYSSSHPAQLASHRRPFPEFAPIEEMQNARLKKIGCGFLQSYYLLGNAEER